VRVVAGHPRDQVRARRRLRPTLARRPAALDGALLVTPPLGTATGYVPIVLGEFPDRVFQNGFN
jgi:hypothetical protein